MTTQEWINELKTISVAELAERIQLLEETFGVSAHAVRSVNTSATDTAEPEEEQTSFNVVLTDAGSQRIGVIKAVRTATSLGLKEAKGLTDELPSVVKEGLDKDAAEALRAELEAAGAAVEIQ